MTVTMPYSLYKKGYSEYNAANYNAAKKTIDVDLPDHDRPKFPADWVKVGNCYRTPNGCKVYFWNKGLAENFEIEHFVSVHHVDSKTIHPGLFSREKVMQFVASFDN